MKIHALGTHSDWYYGGGSWGIPGLQRIADLSAQAGISRLYWRTHNGGQANYPSKVCKVCDSEGYRDPAFKGIGTLPRSYFAYMRHIDYGKWDQLNDMAPIATDAGLEYCHWYTVFEDDHGGHLSSDFYREHPQYHCRTRDGKPVGGSLDFWYPEVREYKLRIISELLQKPASRLLLDFVRRNGTPSADAQGNYRYGYNVEIVEAFRAETGLEAHSLCPGSPEWEVWLEFNSRPVTSFLTEVSALVRQAGRALDLLLWPVDQKQWLALDLRELAQGGAIAEVFSGSHTYSCASTEVHRQLDALGPQLRGSNVKLAPGLPAYHRLTNRGLDEFAGEAERIGCKSFLLMESDAILHEPLTDHLRAISRGKSYTSREVRAVRIEGAPDWAQIPAYHGFIRAYSVEDREPEQQTAFQVAHDGTSLYLRVRCSEKAPENLLPVPCFDRNNYNVLQIGSRAFFDPYESVHLFLDASHQHEDYIRMMVDPANHAWSGQCIADGWDRPWSHTVAIDTEGWEATLVIPFASLEIQDPSGKTLGFQLIRVQNQPREISAWFNTWGRRLTPAEFGHLTLE